jgi:hypothetical protein
MTKGVPNWHDSAPGMAQLDERAGTVQQPRRIFRIYLASQAYSAAIKPWRRAY